MFDKPLQSVTAADLQRLVLDGVTEGRTIEFKRDLPGSKESDRKEFLADVSSFANANGGDLIYGIEDRDGRAIAAAGLIVANVDGEILRLDQMIRTGIGPRIIGCQVHAVAGLTQGPAIVIRVPRSWTGPHIITYQQDFRFYSRSTNGKFRMDGSDVRNAVLRNADIEDRIRTFRAERLGRIVGGDTPVALDGSKFICVHVVPFQSFGGLQDVDLLLAAKDTSLLGPFCARGYSAPVFNIDGFWTSDKSHATATSGNYLQFFRNGIVESVDAWMIPSPATQYPDGIPSLAFPRELFAFVDRVLRLFAAVDLTTPVAVLVSIVGAKGCLLHVDGLVSRRSLLRPLDRSTVLLPDVVIPEIVAVDIPNTLRPLMDALWQAFGSPRCLDYDDAGKWTPQN